MSKIQALVAITFKMNRTERRAILKHFIYRIIFYRFMPYVWTNCRVILKFISKFSTPYTPDSKDPKNFIFLVGGKKNKGTRKLIGPNLTAGAVDWVNRKFCPVNFIIVDSLSKVEDVVPETVLVLTYDWLISGPLNSGFKIEIFKLAFIARARKIKIWVMLGDSFDQRHLIPSSFLVAICGGATILMGNTCVEAEKFGLIFPSSPQVWIHSDANLLEFRSGKPFHERQRLAVLAGSGESRRLNLMNLYSNFLESSGWKIISTNHSLAWSDYVALIKSSQMTITTCFLQQAHITGSTNNKNRLPLNTVTGRVWEGFASGSVVVTNINSVFEALGFVPGKHYLALKEFPSEIHELTFHTSRELEDIAKLGQSHFFNLLQ
jgi:hypothetical protein